MNLPVDQANSGAKYEFCYVFMVKVKFLKSNFQNKCFKLKLVLTAKYENYFTKIHIYQK